MAHSSNDRENKKTLEIKQNFLVNAISDISAYIQLTDTKVSIIILVKNTPASLSLALSGSSR